MPPDFTGPRSTRNRNSAPTRVERGRFAITSLLCSVLAVGALPEASFAQSTANLGELVESGHVQVVKITPDLVAAAAREHRQAVPQELLDYRPDSYRISAGDTILVTVWDHPELMASSGGSAADAAGNGRLVHPDGTFYYPFVGTVKVAGMRIEELRGLLTSKLSHYLQSPQVDVNVAGYGSRVALQGAFKDTSPQDVTTVPLTLSQAVGKAAIDSGQADLSGLTLTRDSKSYRINLDTLHRQGGAAPEIYLKPGDRLYLPFNDRQEAYILGEVLRPQAITFKTADLTLTQALGRAGGLNPATAKDEAVYVIRGMNLDDVEQQPATIYQLDASSPAAFALADGFPVKPGDVVYVGEAGVTRWNRFLSQLLPLSGIIRNATLPGN